MAGAGNTFKERGGNGGGFAEEFGAGAVLAEKRFCGQGHPERGSESCTTTSTIRRAAGTNHLHVELFGIQRGAWGMRR